MKRKITQFLLGVAMSAFIISMPICVHAGEEGGEDTTTETETVGVDGEEIKTSTGNPNDLPYKPGDRPIFLYSNGYVTGYFVIHQDASYTSMSQEQFEAYAQRYCAATGVAYYEPFGEAVVTDDFAATLTEQAESYYGTNIEVAYAVAREIHEARLIPQRSPDGSYDLYWFDYVPEEDGEYHYYRYNGAYYKVKDDVYNEYLALGDNVHSDTAMSNLGVGTGTVFFYADPSDSIKEMPLYLVYQDKETFEEETIYLNPPNFNNMISLQYGDYQVVAGGLYDDRSYPIDMDYPEFTVAEGQSVEVKVKFAAAGENITLAGYTAEEMAEINKQYADSEDYMSDEETEVAPAQFITDQPTQKPQNSKLFWVVMGVVGVVVIGGVIILIIRKRNQEYDY